MINEPEELYHRNCYACHKPKPPSELQPGVSRKPDRTTEEIEICNTCVDKMELIPDGDLWSTCCGAESTTEIHDGLGIRSQCREHADFEAEDESEGKGQDEIFGDDCDVYQQMWAARNLK